MKTKRAFKMKQKVLFIIFKGLSMKETFLYGENPTLAFVSDRMTSVSYGAIKFVSFHDDRYDHI